jgi:hypothetical protein
MTEEVKEKLLSEIGKSNANWKKPEKMLVFKRKNIAYSAYYNEKTGKFGPLLEATIYDGKTLPEICNEYAELIDYREVIKVK